MSASLRPSSDGTDPVSIFQYALAGDVDGVVRLLRSGVLVDTIDPATGMTALHFAIGRDRIDVVRLLISEGAGFYPDNNGRMPSTVAALCEVSEEMSDLVADAETPFDLAMASQDLDTTLPNPSAVEPREETSNDARPWWKRMMKLRS